MQAVVKQMRHRASFDSGDPFQNPTRNQLGFPLTFYIRDQKLCQYNYMAIYMVLVKVKAL